MTTQPTEDKTEYTPTDIKIPNILKQEKNQKVDDSIEPKLGVSEQNDFVIGSSKSSNSTLKNIAWYKEMNIDTSFKEKIYYELFIKKQENYHSTYIISSRCIDALSNGTNFDIRFVYGGNVSIIDLYNSYGKESSRNYALRPLITLKSNVKIDESNLGEGTENSPYNIKL